MSENIFDDNFQESVILPEDENPFRNEIKTSPNIKLNLSGTVTDLSPNRAKTNFFITSEMVADSEGLAHSGFVFSAASYAAMASVNETYSVLVGAKIHFYAPSRVNEIIEFDAHAHFGESKKREVKVTGKTKDIKIFEGTFQIVILEDHIFKLYKDSVQKQSTIRRSEEAKARQEQGDEI